MRPKRHTICSYRIKVFVHVCACLFHLVMHPLFAEHHSKFGNDSEALARSLKDVARYRYGMEAWLDVVSVDAVETPLMLSASRII